MRGVILIITLLLVAGVIFGLPILGRSSWFLVPGVILGWVLFSVLVYYWWAPNNLFFTFVKEGTAKIIVKAGRFQKALIQLGGMTLDNGWNVVPDGTVVAGRVFQGKRHLLGGLRFYGFWPLFDVYIYKFQWAGVTGEGEIQKHPPEILDYILLKEDVYWAKVESAEDKELLPLDLELLLTIRIANPYKALFRIENWLEAVINRIEPRVRDLITQNPYEVLISDMKAIEDRLLEFSVALREKEFSERYGVDLRQIEVRGINPPAEYREATLKKYLAERQKEATVVGGQAQAERVNVEYGAILKKGWRGVLLRWFESKEKHPGK